MAFNVITNTSHLGERLEGGQYSADLIDGLGGNDTIVGHDGADFLLGNTGDDKIYAGSDDTDLDLVSGGDGNDEMYGGGGGDLMDGGAGDDLMGGGTGNDLMFGDTGVRSWDAYSAAWNNFGGSSGLGFVQQQLGVDDNFLNSFNQAESGNDTMWGGTGRDMMFGGWGDDVVGGGVGDDLVVGNRGDDILYAGKGNDVALGGDEDDIIYGGQGNDVIDGDRMPRANLLNEGYGNNYLEAPNENWVPSERVQGGDDILFGGAGNDWINGRHGADMIWGGAGDDRMLAGRDNDTDVFGFIAGHGNDTIGQFNVIETPEDGANGWDDGEDVIFLEGANYDGEFQDAIDSGAIVRDVSNNQVIINTAQLGLEDGGTIEVNFSDPNGAAKFGADNIVLTDDDWVDITQGYQFTEGYYETNLGLETGQLA